MRICVWTILCAAFALVAGPAAAADSQPAFKVCYSTYALCTTASCTPAKDSSETVICDCEVQTGYSLGTEDCSDVELTDEGDRIKSRYYPVKSYAACANDRPWAYCLDKPCVIDAENPAKATCDCTLAQDQGPYVIVTDTYTDKTCTTGTISSATVKDVDTVTEFLKTSDDLKPFPIKVLNEPN